MFKLLGGLTSEDRVKYKGDQMENIGQLLSSELGIFVVCLILIIRECRTAFVEYLNSKRKSDQRRDTDIHIAKINESLQDISKDTKTILARWL